MTPTEWDLLKMLEKDVQRIDRSLIEHRDWHVGLERRIKSLEWIARGDEPPPENEEWWGDRFNQAMSIVKRLAVTHQIEAFLALREEARELARRHEEKSPPAREERC